MSVGAIALDPAHAPGEPGLTGCAPSEPPSERFGRLFRLPAFAERGGKVETALRELGRPGGLMDAKDPLGAGPKALIVDLSLSANNPNNPTHPAGTTFFGQFVDHDITDASSKLRRRPARQAGPGRSAWRVPRRTAFRRLATLFDFGDGETRPNKRIDTKISTPLLTLPLGAIAGHGAPMALPQRNLLRHLTWQLPSAQQVARAMGVPPLNASQLSELASLGVGFEFSTPPWYYVLKEAELLADGLHLGPVGGCIVAEFCSACSRPIPAPTSSRSRAGSPRSRARAARSG